MCVWRVYYIFFDNLFYNKNVIFLLIFRELDEVLRLGVYVLIDVCLVDDF